MEPYSRICYIYVLFPEFPTMLRLTFQHLQRKGFSLRPIQFTSPVVSLSSSTRRFEVKKHDTTEQNQKLELVKDDLLTRLYKKIFTGVPVSKLRASGYILSTHCSQRIDIVNFFETFDMPDTFYSWFLVTEIHVWLIGVSPLFASSGGTAARTADLQASLQCSVIILTVIIQARLMGVGDEGRIVRNALVEALWLDCDNRAKVWTVSI